MRRFFQQETEQEKQKRIEEQRNANNNQQRPQHQHGQFQDHCTDQEECRAPSGTISNNVPDAEIWQPN